MRESIIVEIVAAYRLFTLKTQANRFSIDELTVLNISNRSAIILYIFTTIISLFFALFIVFSVPMLYGMKIFKYFFILIIMFIIQPLSALLLIKIGKLISGK